MFENILKFFKKGKKDEKPSNNKSKSAAKERLHLVLMQDRANVSADFLDLMKQEIIDVIKKYIEVDENAIDVRLTNKENEDGTNGAPALYANIPILNIKNEARKLENPNNDKESNIEKITVKESQKVEEAEEIIKDINEQNEEENKEQEPENEEQKQEENIEEIKIDAAVDEEVKEENTTENK